ncbi:tripartite motif-containing protein 2-like isoform X1 [Limulus polyphemus]|uniref:Tripartite motif-containing protein 2-like isoform X1 n=2 Tax=Limulus polyphemus TaxID=6850 RepID=A0ABM1SLA4_LIMPO|nr:tripartite motif-containing protein 2-like isoform X1 [Limulus polyphemus]XP_022244409.1 tripartite motif-containing protein 2-like isoform X1 [Limulus polyphemus]XP_022244410.1 tripartite motif-containing protein 2-like isoform X1 [Limulus polyphemus]XP_022244411.1 tripartite motif-containing protein 2-like isoform X1 [Limulus polyphemus]XP_022244412.1 tripartite motif-containing protein 2-like isoform X1 [Limulus polyphemus]XP_022244413.1 tripartite motif-containing protein 2-like isoform
MTESLKAMSSSLTIEGRPWPVANHFASHFFLCGMCRNRYTKPKVLPCLHTFCESCLSLYIPAESLTITCPICRQQSILPKQGVPELPNNFFIANLMELLEHPAACQRRECQTPGVRKCMSCDQFFCDTCCGAHKEESPSCDEMIVSISELALLEEQELNKENPSLMCPKHSCQTLRFYCRNCETAVCVTCTDIEHGGHCTVRLRDAIEDQKDSLKVLLRKAYSQVPNLNKAIEIINSTSHDLSQKHSDVLREVSFCFDSLIEVVQMRKSFLLKELDHCHRSKQQILFEQREALEQCLNNLANSCEFTENALTHGNETEILLVNKQIAEKLKEFSELVVKKAPEENSYIAFEGENLNVMKTNIQNFGRIRTNSAIAHETTASGEGLKQCIVGKPTFVNVVTKNRRGEMVKTGNALLETEIVSARTALSFRPEVTAQKNGSYDVIYTVTEEGHYKLAIKLFGKDIKGSPYQVKASVEEGSSSSDRPVSSKIPRTTGVRQRAVKRPPSYPSTTSLSRKNPVEDDFLRRVGNKGRGKGEFTNPQGVCLTPAGYIVVTDSNNQSIQVFSLRGDHKLSFGTKGRSAGQIQRPTGVAVTPTGSYVVADYENKWISVFNSSGKFLGRLGVGKLLGPKGVALDNNGHIIVIDNKACNILIFQENGKLLNKFGSRGTGNTKFAGPHYVAVNSKNHLLVSDFHNHCIKVFDSEGNYISSFGSSGQGNGQFNAPTGVAVDNQDNILVADWGNSRIQVTYNETSSPSPQKKSSCKTIN